MSCGVDCRCGLDPALLWLWCRLVATAPIGPLAWEPPNAAGAAQEMAKRQKNKNKSKITHFDSAKHWYVIKRVSTSLRYPRISYNKSVHNQVRNYLVSVVIHRNLPYGCANFLSGESEVRRTPIFKGHSNFNCTSLWIFHMRPFL